MELGKTLKVVNVVDVEDQVKVADTTAAELQVAQTIEARETVSA